MSTLLNQSPVNDPDLIGLLDRTTSVGAAGGDDGGTDGGSDRFMDEFREACRIDAELHDGDVHPSRVNKMLRERLGDEFNSRQLSSAWSSACSTKSGFLDNTDEPAPIDPTVSRGNGNKTVTLRRWRTAA